MQDLGQGQVMLFNQMSLISKHFRSDGSLCYENIYGTLFLGEPRGAVDKSDKDLTILQKKRGFSTLYNIGNYKL